MSLQYYFAEALTNISNIYIEYLCLFMRLRLIISLKEAILISSECPETQGTPGRFNSQLLKR